VERHRRDLESEPDQQEAQAERRHRREGRAGQPLADERQIRGTGSAEDEGDAVQQERGGERADQEVLERGLRRGAPEAVVARQDVDGDRHHLQPQERDDQVLGGGQEHHAHGGEQHQDVVLRGEQALAIEVAQGVQHRRRRGREDHRFGAEAVGVDGHHPCHAGGRGPAQREHAERGAGQDQAHETQPAGGQHVLLPLVPPRGIEQHDHEPARENQLGQQRDRRADRVGQVERPHGLASTAAVSAVGAPSTSGGTWGRIVST
jgi:hypothetical protein